MGHAIFSRPVTAAKLYPRTALALLTALNLLNYIDRSVLFAVQDLVKAEFHRSDLAFGLLTTVFFIFYMCAAPFMGPLSLRFSRKRVIVTGALVWSVATLLTAFTKNFDELLIRHTLVGIGEASFVILSPTFVADMFPPEKRGRVMGVFYLAIPVGTALGYLLGGVMGPKYGWRAPFYVGAAPGVLLALLLLLIPEPVLGQFDPPESKVPERDTLKSLIRNPAFLTATFGMAMMTFALGGLQVWMPTFLHRAHGYSLGDASLVFGLSTLVNGLVASLAGGYGPVTAVDGVSLDVAPGEVVAVLGASGSGKSSLLRAVAGLEPLAAGLGQLGRRGGDGRARAPARLRGDVPGRPAVPAPVGRRQHRLCPLPAGRAATATARVAELLELVGLAGYGRAPGHGALGRPGAAGGAGPLAGGRAPAAAARRAALGARPGAA